MLQIGKYRLCVDYPCFILWHMLGCICVCGRFCVLMCELLSLYACYGLSSQKLLVFILFYAIVCVIYQEIFFFLQNMNLIPIIVCQIKFKVCMLYVCKITFK